MTEEEIAFCQENGHDLDLALLLQSKSGNPIVPLPSVYGTPSSLKAGFCTEIADRPEIESQLMRGKLALELKNAAARKGYLAFVFEGMLEEGFECQPYHHLAILRGTDEFDIIKWRQTGAFNYHLSTDDIIRKLNSWRIKNDMIILGVGMQWINLQFKTLPSKMNLFLDDVYQFCPDIVSQGTLTLKALKEQIISNNGHFFLWWD